MDIRKTKNTSCTLKDIVNLAAPHTWAASVMPAILALVITYLKQGSVQPFLAVCLVLKADFWKVFPGECYQMK
jgi:1,4-dihydroxy-2-naphthoate octaprenyltransferase